MGVARALRLPISGLLLAAATGCGGPAQVRYRESLEAAPDPAAHAVHSRRLAELMRGFERLQHERLPRAMDVRLEEQRRAAAIAEVAQAMVESADRIADAAAESDFDDEERAEFLRLAGSLKHEALQLAERGPELGPDELRARSAAIEATCDQCHQRFRIPGRVP